jgi:hypothetical protein
VIAHWLHWTFWPESGQGYAFTSSVLGGLGYLAILAVLWRKLVCQSPYCFRMGHHPTADGQHHLCRHHHPDHPTRKRWRWLPQWFMFNVPRPSLSEIHERHHAANRTVD